MIHQSSKGQFAVREGKWKLILPLTAESKVELYDLENDLSEKQDVIEQYPEVGAALKVKLTKIIQSGKSREACISKNDTPVFLYWK